MAIIYRIRRVDTDQCYVGHTVEQPKRWWEHTNRLKSGRHHSPYLQRAWDKYGEDAFVFEVLEECLDEDRVVREQYYMDTLNSCYNCAPAAGSMLGYRFTDEQRARCGVHRIGIKETPEVTEARLLAARAAMLADPFVWITDGITNVRHPVAKTVPDGWYQGRTFPDDVREAMLMASSGPRSEEVRANIKAGHTETWDDPQKRAAMLANRRPFGWWTDGTSSRRVAIDETPPEGWRPGRAIDAQKMVAARGSRPKKEKIPKTRSSTTFANPEHQAKAQAALAVTIANTPEQVWITDGVTNRKLAATATIPEGWSRAHTLSAEGRAAITTAATARFTSEEASRTIKAAWDDPVTRASLEASRQDQAWITNGTETKRHWKSEPIPEGWRRGRGGLFGRAATKAKVAGGRVCEQDQSEQTEIDT